MSTIVNLRIDPKEKRRFRAAADAAGTSLTTFMLGAARTAAAEVEKMSSKSEDRISRTDAISLLGEMTVEARRGGGIRGKKFGYRKVGRSVYQNLESLLSDWPWLERMERLDELRAELKGRKRGAVFAWMCREFPADMAEMPPRRRAEFVAGIFAAWKEAGRAND
jgi:hypothetical protein